MKLALCYPSVLPARGGCETYIVDLARRLVGDGHEVHLYACRWDASALPAAMHYHPLRVAEEPRFQRPWRFGAACLRELRRHPDQVSIGFDKTWGQDILYPQGGLHVATIAHNYLIEPTALARNLARLRRWLDPAYWSFARLERQQYLGRHRPLVVVNSQLVRRHFQEHYGLESQRLRVIPNAIDPGRFVEADRPRRRFAWRQRWGIAPEETVALFAAMNYPLKGLTPLLHAVRWLPQGPRFRLLVAGNPRTAVYERLARRLGIADRVRFVGYCADMRNGYFAADFLVHPTFYDPCSLVVLEALACGLPIITTVHNGAGELLHPPAEGYVIDNPHDHERLAWCLEQLLDPARRSACAQAGRRTAAQWTFEHHYQRLLQVFAEAMAKKRAA